MLSLIYEFQLEGRPMRASPSVPAALINLQMQVNVGLPSSTKVEHGAREQQAIKGKAQFTAEIEFTYH